MFDLLPVPLILSYSLLSIFVFYQQLHIKNFMGSSQAFLLALNASAFVGMLFGFGFLVYYGITFKWYLPLILFAIGFLIKLIFIALESTFQWAALYMSLLAFLGWPASAFAMIYFLPAK